MQNFVSVFLNLACIYPGQALQELSKDKFSIKQMETHTNNFLKALETIENGLSRHITYLTQVATSKPCNFVAKSACIAVH